MGKSSLLTAAMLEKYHKDGYILVPNFLTPHEVEDMKSSCRKLVDEMNLSDHCPEVFTTDVNKQSRSEYFLNSGDNISYFFEQDALDEKGNLKVPKHLSLNKIGHALHWLVPEFRRVSFSDRVKDVARQLSFVSPAIVQSMYIFKQPGYGGEVTPHKDCTFLHTHPKSCVGLWFALEDATTENGCLWFSPGSHHQNTERRFVRQVDEEGKLSTGFTGPVDADDGEYIPVPVPKGSLVILNGSVNHKSARNTSSSSRHIYTFHLIERHQTKWDELNWLQPTEKMPFTGLYEN